MQEEIFISYSNSDKDKVDLIAEELKGNKIFKSKVIASDREALKPLAQKVSKGITDCKVFLPILTKNSMNTQWINQEIGYAMALGKTILPIIEKGIMGKLKGFIHKESDLPYAYDSNVDKTKENIDFLKHIKLLISDAESRSDIKVPDEAVSEKSGFERSMEMAMKINEDRIFQKKRLHFLYSVEGADKADDELVMMFKDLDTKLRKLRKINQDWMFWSENNPISFTAVLEGFSFRIIWKSAHVNSTEDSSLQVILWKGRLTKNSSYWPGEKPDILKSAKYIFDITKDFEICNWLNTKNNKHFSSIEIIDYSLEWILGKVSKEL
jgi:hypothetical protein